MSFELNTSIAKRFTYEAGQRQTFEIPQGNLYSGMSVDINLEVDLAGIGSNAPDYQVARAIQKIEILKGSSVYWSLSGEALAAKFRYQRGVEAPGNASIAGAIANNVQGRMFLRCDFSPEDAARPSDYALDSRGSDWELAITWRNLTVAGTLFGTLAGAVTANQSENYIDVSLRKLQLRSTPDGKADSYENLRPFMRGLREVIEDVTATQDGFLIQPAKLKTYRNILLWSTHMANTLQKVGVNTVLTDKIVIDDTQDKIYHTIAARSLREETGLRWGVGSALPAGLYEIPLTAFGNLVDEIVSDNVVSLRIKPDVTKLANATSIHCIYDTTEKQ